MYTSTVHQTTLLMSQIETSGPAFGTLTIGVGSPKKLVQN